MAETPYKNLTHFDANRLANSYDTDYRSEVVIASLIEQGYDPELIEVFREGMARRGIAKDLEHMEVKHSYADQIELLHVKTNREGLYDMLPEWLFHQPTKKRLNSDKEQVIDEIKIHAQKEFFARKFFHPFENEADKILTEAMLFETKYDRKVTYSEFSTIFLPYWPVLSLLGHKQAVFFIYILAVFHKIRLDYRNIAEALSLLLDVPVQITEIKMPAKKAESHFESQLNKSSAGLDFVLGNSFDDGEYDLKILIGPISAIRMRSFLVTAKDYQLLQELCYLLLPVAVFFEFEFKTIAEDSVFLLSDDTKETYLGINSFI